jgi:hypothetical protein
LKGGNLGTGIVFCRRTGSPDSRALFMARRPGCPPRARGHRDPRDCTSDLQALLSPEGVFSDPFGVVAAPGLTIAEKRAILARWLARICADEAAFGLKWMPPASCEPVEFDAVMDALRALEQGSAQPARGEREGANVALRRRPQKSVGTLH